MLSRAKAFVGIGASAGLVAVSFESAMIGWLAIIGLAVFFSWLHRHTSLPTALFGGLLFGLLTMGSNLRWFLAPRPEEWAGVQDPTVAFALKLFVWAGSSLVLALGIVLFTLGFVYLSRRNWVDVILLPSLWVLGEYARNWLFVFWSWGSQSVLAPNWTFGAMGYSLVGTPLAHLSRLGGLYGLSWVAVFLAASLFFCFALAARERGRVFRSAAALAGIGGALVFVSWIAKDARLEYQKPIRFGLLQTGLAENVFYTRSLGLLLSEDIASGKLAQPLDAVVFPEGSQLLARKYLGAEQSLLAQLFPTSKGLVITGAWGERNGKRVNQIIYRSAAGDTLSVQDKYFLIPTGEFMPNLLALFIRIFRREQVLEQFEMLRATVRADAPEHPVPFNGYAVGATSCSGIISPEHYRNLAAGGAQILVNTASHALFRGSPFFLRQMEIYARLHALSLARPFLQSSHGGYAFAIDANGKMLAKSPALGHEILYVSARPVSGATPFSRFGHLPVLAFSLGAVLIALFLKLWKSSQSLVTSFSRDRIRQPAL